MTTLDSVVIEDDTAKSIRVFLVKCSHGLLGLRSPTS